eukprot:RCo046704
MALPRTPPASLHYHCGLEVGLVQALVGQHLRAHANQTGLQRHVLAKHGTTFHVTPVADAAVPADDGLVHPAVAAQNDLVQQGAVLKPSPFANDAALGYSDVGTQHASSANFDVFRQKDVPLHLVRRVALCQDPLSGRGLGEEAEIHRNPQQIVLGLPNVHPVALQVHDHQLLSIRHGWERLLLNARGLHLDPVQDRRVENVQPSVDPVGDEHLGLLHKALHASVGLGHDHPVDRRVLHLRGHNGALLAVPQVKGQQLLQRVGTRDVAVQHEERAVVRAQQKGPGQRQGTRCAQGLLLLGVGNLNSQLNLPIVHVLLQLLGLVRHSQHDLHTSHLLQRTDLVHNHWDVGKGDNRLGHGEGQRPQTSPEAPNQDHRLEVLRRAPMPRGCAGGRSLGRSHCSLPFPRACRRVAGKGTGAHREKWQQTNDSKK